MNRTSQTVLTLFETICTIPHGSHHEEALGSWIIQWANSHHLPSYKDSVGNIKVTVPASEGYELSPTIVLQFHMDMVCEKTPESTHNFSTDPLQLVYEEEWLHAHQTSLGADNGMGMALGMAIVEEKKHSHPQLELLFTVQEETGLEGATSLTPDLITGKILLNIDSEDEGVFTIGCAGGVNTNTAFPIVLEERPSTYSIARVEAGGMRGGHSGVNIHEQRANAIRVLTRVLEDLQQHVPFRLADILGGTAHNAIPRNAEATILYPTEKRQELESHIHSMGSLLQHEFQFTEPDLSVTLKGIDNTIMEVSKALTIESTQKVMDYIRVFPHGVAAMSSVIPHLVETSNNLAKVWFDKNQLHVLSSQRSSVPSRLTAHTRRIEALARLAGGTYTTGTGYPSWEPNWNSPLLNRSKEVYFRVFSKKAKVEVIHAGLECGIIGSKFPDMDMISFGPTIQNPHSPNERVHLDSIDRAWDFLKALLKSFK